MTGESLHRGPERILSETVKVDPRMCRRHQDFGGGRVKGCLPGQTAYKEPA